MENEHNPLRRGPRFKWYHYGALALAALVFLVVQISLRYWWLVGAFACFGVLYLFEALTVPRQQTSAQRRVSLLLSALAVSLTVIGVLVHILLPGWQ